MTAQPEPRLGSFYLKRHCDEYRNSTQEDLNLLQLGLRPDISCLTLHKSHFIYYTEHSSNILDALKGKEAVHHHKGDVTAIKVSSGGSPYCIQSHVGIIRVTHESPTNLLWRPFPF